jgi:hypothetical protein
MKEDFAKFLDGLLYATSRIKPHYFQLPIAGQEEPSYRERVYCYELYHQLRSILTDDFSYVLNGEVDKHGHPLLRDEIGPRKPDFTVHFPRDMTRNLVTIEVKPITATRAEFQEAVQSLRTFIQHAQYFGAIALVYGLEDQSEGRRIEDFHKILEGIEGRPILLLRHFGAGESARIACDLSLHQKHDEKK